METKRKRKPEGIHLRLSYDISKSHYQYQSEAVKGMLNKLPKECTVHPEMFMHIFGLMIKGDLLYSAYKREIGDQSYDEIIAEMEHKRNGKKRK